MTTIRSISLYHTSQFKSLNNVRYPKASIFHNFSSNFQTTFPLFNIVTHVTRCFRLTPRSTECKHLLKDSAFNSLQDRICLRFPMGGANPFSAIRLSLLFNDTSFANVLYLSICMLGNCSCFYFRPLTFFKIKFLHISHSGPPSECQKV